MNKKTTDYSNILNELVKAVKTLKLYAIGHPNLDASLEKYIKLLQGISAEHGDIVWKIDHKGFYLHDTQLLPKQPAVEQLARDCYIRRITQLVITPRVTLDELKAFLTLLSVDARALIAEGGTEKFLAKRHVEGILINEMDLDALKKLMDELDAETDENEEEDLAEDEEEEEVEEEETEEKDDLTEEERSLNMLIKEIDTERDYMRYNDLSLRINEKAFSLISDKRFPFALASLKLFNRHAKEETGLPDDLRKTAEARLDDLLRKDMIYYLTVQVVTGEGDNLDELGDLLLHGGAEAQSILINNLLECQSAAERRKLFTVITMFGDSVRPEIEKRLTDERWYAVRQMAALLGELGGEESLLLLERAFKHEDLRVRREVLKAFAKFQSERAFSFLLSSLKDKETSVQAQAALSLGIMKKPEAIEALGEIASKKEGLQDASELKKEAIKALGSIGDPKAVPYLRKVIKMKVWFGKTALEELRPLAVNSLGKIGGEEALAVLEEISDSLEGTVYETCKRILEGANRR